MNEAKYIELINKEISGEITPQERDELHRYLQANAEARKVYSQLLETSRLLGEVRDVEPPRHLKQRIMASLDFGRYETTESVPALRFMQRVKRLSLKPSLAYAFALGIVVGLIAYSALLTRPPGRYATEARDLYGTIGITEDASFTLVERLPLSLEQVSGRVDLSSFGDLLLFDVSLSGRHPYEIVMEYDPGQAAFNGLRPGGAGRSLLEVGDGSVRVSGSGDGEFDLSFLKSMESMTIDLKLAVSGETVCRHTFALGPRDAQESDSKRT